MWSRFYPRIALIITAAVVSGALIPIAFAFNWTIYACTLLAVLMVANAISRRRFSLAEVGIFMALVAVGCRLLQSHYHDLNERAVAARNRELSIVASLLRNCEAQVGMPLASQMSWANGPPHSWRTWALFRMGLGDLLNGYDMRHAWNNPANTNAKMPAPQLLRHPQAGGPPNEASVVLIVGARRNTSSMSDPESREKVIIALDIAHSGIPWTEPRDMTAEEILEIVENRGIEALSPNSDGSVTGICLDGSLVHFSRDALAPYLRQLIRPSH
jgi:hypothetical protein